MFIIQAAAKYTEKNIRRYLLFGAIVVVVAVTSLIAYYIGNAESGNTTVVDTIALTCDINLNDSNEISIYKFTVAGYLSSGKEFSKNIPPMVFQSFDLITDGRIENIENFVLFVYINGSSIQYDIIYAVLEEVDIGNSSKRDRILITTLW